MATIEWFEKKIFSWKEYIEAIDQIQSDLPEAVFLFRGQSDHEWGLDPSLLRIFKERNSKLSPEKAFKLEKDSVYKFRQEAHHYLKPSVLPPDLVNLTNASIYGKWLALMQHHGVPTRLLDWTYSFYVALFFAVENQNSEGAVWYFDSNKLSEHYGLFDIDYTTKKSEELFGGKSDDLLFTGISSLQSLREIAQQGGFTFSNGIFKSHESLIAKACSNGTQIGQGYGKILVPADLKLEFLWRLEKANITAKTLFPGIDGIGRSLRDYIMLSS